ncbi:MAG: aminomethyl-transferring glycine dehydrogenase subunit GcvPA [Planctomycetota bacterium]|jgi:glycine dehydrogenase subunit 1
MGYVPHTDEDRQQMLRAIGVEKMVDLFTSIPANVVLNRAMDLPSPLPEPDLIRHMKSVAARNRTEPVSFLGGGCYDHYIPPAVDALAGRSEFVTAYTPYQPEISQGVLQAFYEYQSMICELTGLEVANASMYDGATSLAEALLLCIGSAKKKKKVVLAKGIHPDFRRVVRTYLGRLGIEIVEVPLAGGVTAPERIADAAPGAAGVAFQSPNALGFIEDGAALAEAAHGSGAMCISVVDPISLALLEAPGVQGVDVAVGEGQGLGNPISFGGPHFGFFAAREKDIRRLPGRVVGATVDGGGKRGFVLTFQTREQHIRREKATSNICTNQGLMALRASVYMALLGPEGLAEVARACVRNAHGTADSLAGIPGFRLLHEAPFFKEFPLLCPKPGTEVVEALLEEGFFAGVPLSRLGMEPAEGLLVAVTERRTGEEIDAFTEAVSRRFARAGGR